MPQPDEDIWVLVLANAVFFGSIAAWIAIIASWRRNGYVLRYVPRQPVPWGPVAAVLPVLLAVLSVSEGLLATFAEPSSGEVAITESITISIAAGILLQTGLAAAFVLAVVVVSRATAHDIGLPSSFREFVQDVGIGILTCLAAVVPVFAILALLRAIFHIEDVSRHPLVEVVNRSGDAGVLMLASVAAVLVAPVIEELLFRLLLQGWLEKWLDPVRKARALREQAAVEPSGEGEPVADPAWTPDSVLDSITGLTHWTPIVISSVLFAAAHFGYGPEPVPIFILALFLGYVYQRTHRIVPCMVAHGMFNSISMFMLWRLVVNGG